MHYRYICMHLYNYHNSLLVNTGYTGERWVHTDSQLYQLYQPNRTVCWMCCSTEWCNKCWPAIVPVCCDDRLLRNTNCNNTREESCDTRFRWTIRPFAASLETRPSNILNPGNPTNYFFTNCPTSPNSVCPFPQVSTTFPQGPLGFLGVAANPLPVVSGTMWTVSCLVMHWG